MNPQNKWKISPVETTNFNSIEDSKLEQVVKKVQKSSEAVRQSFQSAYNQPATCEEIVEMSTERNNAENKLLELAENTHQLI